MTEAQDLAVENFQEGLLTSIKGEFDTISLFVSMAFDLTEGEIYEETPQWLKDKQFAKYAYFDYLVCVIDDYIDGSENLTEFKASVVAYFTSNDERGLNLSSYKLHDIYKTKVEKYIDENINVLDSIRETEIV